MHEMQIEILAILKGFSKNIKSNNVWETAIIQQSETICTMMAGDHVCLLNSVFSVCS